VPAEQSERLAASASTLLERYGVVSREIVNADHLDSFSQLYPIFQALEGAGKLRRGYFVSGLSATQFALPSVFSGLRANAQSRKRSPPVLLLAAVDPGNPYGAMVPWPEVEPRPQRIPGATVFICEGRLIAYLSRGANSLTTFLSADTPSRDRELIQLLTALKKYAHVGSRPLLCIETIDQGDARGSNLAEYFCAAGFKPCASGLTFRASQLDAAENCEGLETPDIDGAGSDE
jgi:ATP-dependent Lhr-like helicase